MNNSGSGMSYMAKQERLSAATQLKDDDIIIVDPEQGYPDQEEKNTGGGFVITDPKGVLEIEKKGYKVEVLKLKELENHLFIPSISKNSKEV